MDIPVFGDEARTAVGDVLEELKVAGIRSSDHVAEDDKERT